MMKGIRLSALETDVLCPQKWYLRRHNTSFHTGLSEYSQSFSDGLPFTVRKYISLYAESVVPIKVIYCVDWVTWTAVPLKLDGGPQFISHRPPNCQKVVTNLNPI